MRSLESSRVRWRTPFQRFSMEYILLLLTFLGTALATAQGPFISHASSRKGLPFPPRTGRALAQTSSGQQLFVFPDEEEIITINSPNTSPGSNNQAGASISSAFIRFGESFDEEIPFPVGSVDRLGRHQFNNPNIGVALPGRGNLDGNVNSQGGLRNFNGERTTILKGNSNDPSLEFGIQLPVNSHSFQRKSVGQQRSEGSPQAIGVSLPPAAIDQNHRNSIASPGVPLPILKTAEKNGNNRARTEQQSSIGVHLPSPGIGSHIISTNIEPEDTIILTQGSFKRPTQGVGVPLSINLNNERGRTQDIANTGQSNQSPVFGVPLPSIEKSSRPEGIIRDKQNRQPIVGVSLPLGEKRQSQTNEVLLRSEVSQQDASGNAIGVPLPTIENKSLRKEVPNVVNGRVPLPVGNNFQLRNERVRLHFGIPPPKAGITMQGDIAGTSSFGVPLPNQAIVNLRREGAIAPKGNQGIGVPLPLGIAGQQRSRFSSDAGLGGTFEVPLSSQATAVRNGAISSNSNQGLGIPLPLGNSGQPRSEFSPNVGILLPSITPINNESPLRTIIQEGNKFGGSGVPLEISGVSFNSEQNSFTPISIRDEGLFSLTEEDFDDDPTIVLHSRNPQFFNKGGRTGGSVTSTKGQRPVLGFSSIEDDDDDYDDFSEETHDNSAEFMSLGRRYHPVGIPRRMDPVNNPQPTQDTPRGNTEIVNPFIFTPEKAMLFDESGEDSDSIEDDVIVKVSHFANLLNPDTFEERISLANNFMNQYNFVDLQGSSKWGYKTEDQYQDHTLDKDGNMEGRFGWVSPGGEKVNIQYIADRGGYRVVSSSGLYKKESESVSAARNEHLLAHERSRKKLYEEKTRKSHIPHARKESNIGVPMPEGEGRKIVETTGPMNESPSNFPTVGIPLQTQKQSEVRTNVDFKSNVRSPEKINIGVPLPNSGNSSPQLKAENIGSIGVPLPLPTHEQSEVRTNLNLDIKAPSGEQINIGVSLPSTGDSPPQLKAEDIGSTGVPIPFPIHEQSEVKAGLNLDSKVPSGEQINIGVSLPNAGGFSPQIITGNTGSIGAPLPFPTHEQPKVRTSLDLDTKIPSAEQINIGVSLPNSGDFSPQLKAGNKGSIGVPLPPGFHEARQESTFNTNFKFNGQEQVGVPLGTGRRSDSMVPSIQADVRRGRKEPIDEPNKEEEKADNLPTSGISFHSADHKTPKINDNPFTGEHVVIGIALPQDDKSLRDVPASKPVSKHPRFGISKPLSITGVGVTLPSDKTSPAETPSSSSGVGVPLSTSPIAREENVIVIDQFRTLSSPASGVPIPASPEVKTTIKTEGPFNIQIEQENPSVNKAKFGVSLPTQIGMNGPQPSSNIPIVKEESTIVIDQTSSISSPTSGVPTPTSPEVRTTIKSKNPVNIQIEQENIASSQGAIQPSIGVALPSQAKAEKPLLSSDVPIIKEENVIVIDQSQTRPSPASGSPILVAPEVRTIIKSEGPMNIQIEQNNVSPTQDITQGKIGESLPSTDSLPKTHLTPTSPALIEENIAIGKESPDPSSSVIGVSLPTVPETKTIIENKVSLDAQILGTGSLDQGNIGVAIPSLPTHGSNLQDDSMNTVARTESEIVNEASASPHSIGVQLSSLDIKGKPKQENIVPSQGTNQPNIGVRLPSQHNAGDSQLSSSFPAVVGENIIVLDQTKTSSIPKSKLESPKRGNEKFETVSTLTQTQGVGIPFPTPTGGSISNFEQLLSLSQRSRPSTGILEDPLFSVILKETQSLANARENSRDNFGVPLPSLGRGSNNKNDLLQGPPFENSPVKQSFFEQGPPERNLGGPKNSKLSPGELKEAKDVREEMKP